MNDESTEEEIQEGIDVILESEQKVWTLRDYIKNGYININTEALKEWAWRKSPMYALEEPKKIIKNRKYRRAQVSIGKKLEKEKNREAQILYEGSEYLQKSIFGDFYFIKRKGGIDKSK